MASVAGGVDDAQGGKGPSVTVIGAGAAGLAAGRILRDEGLRVTIYEKSRHHFGGVWRYDPSPEVKTPMSCYHFPCISFRPTRWRPSSAVEHLSRPRPNESGGS
ncbi:unnamed protein product [Ascophyllum nodosum]